MHLTKFSGLTDDELIQATLSQLTNEDELIIELLDRFMTARDNVESWEVDMAKQIDAAAELRIKEWAIEGCDIKDLL